MVLYHDIFISYGRADSQPFAVRLKQRLLKAGLSVWLDLEDIPKGVDYQQQIDSDMEKAHNVLFIMSPHAVNSDYCRLEIERALVLHKRLIPLLHVAEISQETWQQRHPNATAQDWRQYQANGLHYGDNRNPNLHLAIRKINWLPFAEDEPAFEEAVQGLLSLLQRHQDYVHQHTALLVKALAWAQHQKQLRYLLVAEERQQAQDWLLRRFEDEQPPCTPTDLHCEFITESLKNARNLMTQVFLVAAAADQEASEPVRRRLMRAGLTVWSNKTDVQMGTDLQSSIARGIEEADNLIYLLSPAALSSPDCQAQLDYAVSLHKRIIPAMVQPIDVSQLPDTLQTLQLIDLTQVAAKASAFEREARSAEGELLRILQQEATYYEEHKVLLAKALKWQRQHQNPSLLLRGYNLRYAETWLKLALQRRQHQPTQLHQTFIQESLRQPPDSSLDVFISYSRADADFARQLNDALQAQGKRTWFDQESIAAGTADFSREIRLGIEASDNFLFVLSPKSTSSPYCADEVEYAVGLHKRLVTILYRPLGQSQLHPELAKVQWIDFARPPADFNVNFNQLVRVLDTDREHVHNHTKWLQHAIEWTQQAQSADLLLRGSECAIASAWLEQAEQYHKQPAPTALQKTFIQASRDAIAQELQLEQRRNWILRSLTLVMSAVAAIAVVSSLWAFRIQRQAQQSEIAALIESARIKFRSGQQLDALLTSLQAGRALQSASWLQRDADQTLEAEVMASLHQAIHWTREQYRFEGYTSGVGEMFFSPDGRTLATYVYAQEGTTANLARTDGTALTLYSQPDEPLKKVVLQPYSELDAVPTVPSPVMALLGQEGTVELWRSDGSLVKQITLPNKQVEDVDLSAQSQILLTYHKGENRQGDRLFLWSTRDGKLKNQLRVKSGWGYRLNPKQQLIAVSQSDQTTQLRSLDGRLIAVLEGTVWSWSQDGQQLATYRKRDGTVRLWRADGSLVATLAPPEGEIQSLFFSPDGQTIAVQVEGGPVQLWSRAGKLITALQNKATPKNTGVSAIRFSPDGQWLSVNYPYSETTAVLQLWKPDGTAIKTLRVNSSWWGTEQSFSADSQWFALASHQDGTVLLVERKSARIKKLVGHEGAVIALEFSPDSQTLATASQDSTVKLWELDGSPIMTLTGHYDWVRSLAFSPDNKLLATASDDRTVKLWKTTHEGLASLAVTNYVISSLVDPDTGSRQAASDMLVAALEDGSIQMWKGSPFERSLTTLLGPTAGDVQLRLIYPSETILYEYENGYEGSASRPPAAVLAEVKSEQSYGPVKLWQPDGKPLATILDRPSQSVKSVDVQASNDGQIILSAVRGDTFFGPVQIWQADGRLIATLIERTENGEGVVKINRKGQYIATQFNSSESNQPGQIMIWRWDGKLVSVLQPDAAGAENLSFDFMGDLPSLVTWSNRKNGYGPVQLWQLKTGTSKTLLSGTTDDPKIASRQIEVYWDNQGEVLSTAISTLDKSDDSAVGPIQLWRPDGTLLKTLVERVETAEFGWITSSPDGQLFVLQTMGENMAGPVLLWQRQLDKLVTLLESAESGRYAEASFSQDSQLLLLTVSDGKSPALLWQRDGSLIKTLVEQTKGFTSGGFSPDQKHIVVTQNGVRNIGIWDRQGREVSSFDTGHKGEISSILFSPNGDQIATASWDQTIKLWSLKGQLNSIFTDHTASVIDLRFTADGSQLVSIGDGTPKTLILRDLTNLNNLDLLVENACQLVNNYLDHSINTTDVQKHLCELAP